MPRRSFLVTAASQANENEGNSAFSFFFSPSLCAVSPLWFPLRGPPLAVYDSALALLNCLLFSSFHQDRPTFEIHRDKPNSFIHLPIRWIIIHSGNATAACRRHHCLLFKRDKPLDQQNRPAVAAREPMSLPLSELIRFIAFTSKQIPREPSGRVRAG
jgi:hypothetical protein